MGLIHLDAGVFIGFLNADAAHHGSATSTQKLPSNPLDSDLAIVPSGYPMRS